VDANGNITKLGFDMAIKIKPLADRVLIEPMAAETKTASGIIIPDNAKEKPQKGKVVAVGNGTKDEKMTVSKGDTVLYGKYAGTELKLEGQNYLIMRESDILAIV
jgi:chaperonin GroES